MVRIDVAKRLEADQPHELVDFIALFMQYAARDQSGLNIAANGQPREKVRILKNEAALRAGLSDRLGTD